jgi:hypothetical protein
MVDIGQGGTIRTDFGDIKNLTLNIKSKWQDHCNIEIFDNLDEGFSFDVQKDQETLVVSKPSEYLADEKCAKRIDIIIPEYFNLLLNCNEANINIFGKIQGDVIIRNVNGTINLEKCRGMNIDIDSSNGLLAVSKYLEGIMILSNI